MVRSMLRQDRANVPFAMKQYDDLMIMYNRIYKKSKGKDLDGLYRISEVYLDYARILQTYDDQKLLEESNVLCEKALRIRRNCKEHSESSCAEVFVTLASNYFKMKRYQELSTVIDSLIQCCQDSISYERSFDNYSALADAYILRGAAWFAGGNRSAGDAYMAAMDWLTWMSERFNEPVLVEKINYVQGKMNLFY